MSYTYRNKKTNEIGKSVRCLEFIIIIIIIRNHFLLSFSRTCCWSELDIRQHTYFIIFHFILLSACARTDRIHFKRETFVCNDNEVTEICIRHTTTQFHFACKYSCSRYCCISLAVWRMCRITKRRQTERRRNGRNALCMYASLRLEWGGDNTVYLQPKRQDKRDRQTNDGHKRWFLFSVSQCVLDLFWQLTKV